MAYIVACSNRVIVAMGILAFAAMPCAAKSHRVDVGGYRLNLRCVGEGSPVVILDAGAGDTLDTWDWVVPDVRRLTRVCAYDRAGLGRSDAGPSPRTSGRIADELKILLSRARVQGPYVLVGHSFGALNVRLFASRNPDEVVGLVLVDGTPEEFPAIESSLMSRDEAEKLRTARGMAPAAFLAELDAMSASAAAVGAARPTEAPVIVLSAAHPDDPPQFRAAWAAMQQRMVLAIPNARQIVADRSGHYIQFDEPELVVNAIGDLIGAARVRTPGSIAP